MKYCLTAGRSLRLVTTFLMVVFVQSCGNGSKTEIPAGRPAANLKTALRQRLDSIIRGRQATVGLAVASLEDSSDTLSIRGDETFPLMSVAKFPQALLLLHLADIGAWDREQPIAFGPGDLEQRTGSNIRKDHPQAAFRLSLPEVLRYMIGQSDNITGNKVFALEGGPGAVEAYMHSLGIRDIRIAADYAHLNPDSPKQNGGTPKALLQLLCRFHRGGLLSDSSRQLLWTAMVNATSGPDRLKGGLPEGTLIGHKTGTSSADERTGVTPAFNDAGIIRLPDGRHYAMVVFVADSKKDNKDNAAIIAALSKAVWEYFSGKH